MNLVNRLAELDREAVRAGWLGGAVPISARDVRREMATTPPGWIVIGAVAVLMLLFVSLPAGAAGLAALVVAWTGWAVISIRGRHQSVEADGLAQRRGWSFVEGQQVVVLVQPYYGARGTLVRPASLLGKRAWLVELDLGRTDRLAIRRDRIAETGLAPAEFAAELTADKRRRRAASARVAFSVFAPAAVGVWYYLPRAIAIAVDVVIAGAAVVAWRPRRR